MAVGTYFRALREEHKTPRGRAMPLNTVARRVGEVLRRDVHASTISRIEQGADLGWDLLTALLDVLGGDIDDVRWVIVSRATPEDAAIRARDTLKRLMDGKTPQRAEIEAMWRAEAAQMSDHELEEALAAVRQRRIS